MALVHAASVLLAMSQSCTEATFDDDAVRDMENIANGEDRRRAYAGAQISSYSEEGDMRPRGSVRVDTETVRLFVANAES
jgi:hypothetical protein